MLEMLPSIPILLPNAHSVGTKSTTSVDVAPAALSVNPQISQETRFPRQPAARARPIHGPTQIPPRLSRPCPQPTPFSRQPAKILVRRLPDRLKPLHRPSTPTKQMHKNTKSLISKHKPQTHNASLQLWQAFVEGMAQVSHRLTTHIDELRALVLAERDRVAALTKEMHVLKDVLAQTVSRYRLVADESDFLRFVREARLENYLGIVVGLREFKIVTSEQNRKLGNQSQSQPDRGTNKSREQNVGLPSIHRRNSQNFDTIPEPNDPVEVRLRQIVNNSKNDLLEFDGILRGWTSWGNKKSKSKERLNKEALARLEKEKGKLEDEQFDQNTTMPRTVVSKVPPPDEDFRRESDYLEILSSGVVERKHKNRISLHAPSAIKDNTQQKKQAQSYSQTSPDVKPIRRLNNNGNFLNNIDYNKFGVQMSSIVPQSAPRVRNTS